MTLVRFTLRACAAQARGDQSVLFGKALRSPLVVGGLKASFTTQPQQMMDRGGWTPVWDRRYSGSFFHVRSFVLSPHSHPHVISPLLYLSGHYYPAGLISKSLSDRGNYG